MAVGGHVVPLLARDLAPGVGDTFEWPVARDPLADRREERSSNPVSDSLARTQNLDVRVVALLDRRVDVDAPELLRASGLTGMYANDVLNCRSFVCQARSIRFCVEREVILPASQARASTNRGSSRCSSSPRRSRSPRRSPWSGRIMNPSPVDGLRRFEVGWNERHRYASSRCLAAPSPADPGVGDHLEDVDGALITTYNAPRIKVTAPIAAKSFVGMLCAMYQPIPARRRSSRRSRCPRT